MAKLKETNLEYTAPKDNNSAILGTLAGPCADIINPTRNERKYDESLWEKVFNNDIVKEYFEAGGILGELGHPADRTETDLEKVAICMPEPPVKGKDGLLIGKWNILDTPNGRILKTLVDYGYKIGISSRGSGDVYSDVDGTEHVDEDTYDFQAFDAVILPAVKAARLTPVTESFKKNKSLKQALTEELNKAGAAERIIMEETLNNLNIGYSSEKSNNIVSESVEDTSIQEEAVDNGLNELMESYQDAVKENANLQVTVLELQKEKAVSDTKVSKLEEELKRYKGLSANLSTQVMEVKALEESVSSLEAELKQKTELVEKYRTRLNGLQRTLKENKDTSNGETKNLTESLSAKANEVKRLEESLETQKTTYESEIKTLNEKYSSLQEEANLKIAKSRKTVNQYKEIVNQTVNRYIESKATMIGVTPAEIKNRLNESYSIDDIDQVCDELQDYRVSISKLPFNLSNTKVRVTESKNENLKVKSAVHLDDDVDDELLQLAGLK